MFKEILILTIVASAYLILDPFNSNRDSSAPALGVHERENLTTPTSTSIGGESSSAAEPVDVEARKQMPPKNDPTKPGARSRRSRSNPPQRVPHSSRQESGSDYSILTHSVLETENARNQAPPASFIPQPHHFPPAVSPYNQRSDFGGPYTMSTQPGSMNIQLPPPTYAFTPAYHHTIPQNMHANYQPMLQPHTPVFGYARSSTEGTPQPHPSFSNAPSPAAYTAHPSSTPTTPHMPPSSSRGGSPYGGSGPFHSLQYPSTMVMPTYGYPLQTYPSSPMYQPSYPAPTYGQQFPSPGESEPQLAWYYFPHLSSGPSQSYDPGPSYQGHYAVGYSQVGNSGVDHSFPSEGRGSGQGGPSGNYPSSPSRYHDNRSGSPPIVPGPVPLQPTHLADEITAAPPSSFVGGGIPAASDRPQIRRSFHPNPPAHRSDWVMWVGNVPADATHDEIWRFFIAAPDDGKQEGSTNGVVSVFLISRSNCAFINYQSMEDLQQAITRSNGVPLRANDSRCPRLVCRVRRTDDDLKAGVGFQRGMGMHTRWIKEQKLADAAQKAQSAASEGTPSSASPGSASESLAGPLSNVSLSSDDDGGKAPNPPHSSSSDSYSSTNSSFLSRHFPIRYFILKSLSQASHTSACNDLDISVSRGIWATQKHNEEILDQAFRTSKEVYLIFGVNKSREFYGYARMIGPVLRGQSDVQWTSRSPQHSTEGPQASLPISASQTSSQPGTFFSPSDHRLVDNSPLAVGDLASTSEAGAHAPLQERHSAPALLGEEYRRHSLLTPQTKPQSLDQRAHLKRGQTGRFALDTSAPVRAIRGHENPSEREEPRASTSALDLVHEEDVDNPEADDEINDLTTPVIQPEEDVNRGGEISWGDNFAVEWLCRERLSFNNTRHLRNPWNRDKEIKVSRDGTELEPSVGLQLLEEWHRLAEAHATTPASASGKTPMSGSGRRGTGSKPEYPFPIVDGVVGMFDADGVAGSSHP
ncbi:hypothetical protein HYPSUDRAFT_208667 [Hypholoma sublateritium FD-334 SS-4]|uniref:YTH domain-containing protein n=1 Tax=Hypholoma sublateritium (strain FD-334 SS-4) TaxID=945553 RepID=A0A0D2N5P1_HYPSF|nr:hypothetical protein HYPSUDRAFT_208667 [Hypholoma sublateritium FD-334 SS-4]